VNSVGNLGGYVGPNIPIWAKLVSADKSAALYIIAGVLMVGAFLTFVFIPKTLRVRVGVEEPAMVGSSAGVQAVR